MEQQVKTLELKLIIQVILHVTFTVSQFLGLVGIRMIQIM